MSFVSHVTLFKIKCGVIQQPNDFVRDAGIRDRCLGSFESNHNNDKGDECNFRMDHRNMSDSSNDQDFEINNDSNGDTCKAL